MKRVLMLLLAVCLLPTLTLAEEPCPLCGGASEQCLTDEYGAVYCAGTLVSYPEDRTAKHYTVREGTRIIGEYAFSNNIHIEDVVLPEGIVMIGEGAFSYGSLKGINLPDSLLIIDDMAFYYCPDLSGVVLPGNLYVIGNMAFSDNWQMTTIDIPASVRVIGRGAFTWTGLTEVYLRTCKFQYGDAVFDVSEQFNPMRPITVHMSEKAAVYWEASQFMRDYKTCEHLTFVLDLPHED